MIFPQEHLNDIELNTVQSERENVYSSLSDLNSVVSPTNAFDLLCSQMTEPASVVQLAAETKRTEDCDAESSKRGSDPAAGRSVESLNADLNPVR